MSNPASTGLSSIGLAADSRSVNALRANAARDPKAAVREAAKQFEALFMQELLKSMRQASMTSGMLDNEGSKLGNEMLDTQLAGQMTGMPGGLADAIARQLERQMGIAPAATGQAPAGTSGKSAAPLPAGARLSTAGNPATNPAPAAASTIERVAAGAAQRAFIARHGEGARAAEAATGIPAAFMIAQAAHETGWGRRDIRMSDGSPSHNLFGIKAGANWKGPVAEVATTEFIDGRPQRVTARFRAYATPQESFADYARMMSRSARYRDVVAQADNAQSFAQGLQRAGYATDPAYADKLTRVINTTLRLQRAQA